jgi:hypothetical protein
MCRTSRRNILSAFGFALLMMVSRFGPAQTSAVSAPSGDDWIAHPPVREEFLSADGRQRLVISSVDEQAWTSRRSRAEMQRNDGAVWRSEWRLDLPHAYRPRFALATPQGGAVLLDEWINIRSPMAIMVIGPDGRRVAVVHVDAVIRLLGVHGAQVVTVARHGIWLQSPPSLSADGQQAEVRTAGRVLRIRLSDGNLSLV